MMTSQSLTKQLSRFVEVLESPHLSHGEAAELKGTRISSVGDAWIDGLVQWRSCLALVLYHSTRWTFTEPFHVQNDTFVTKPERFNFICNTSIVLNHMVSLYATAIKNNRTSIMKSSHHKCFQMALSWICTSMSNRWDRRHSRISIIRILSDRNCAGICW